MARLKDLTGQTFGRLKVLRRSEHKSTDGRVQWDCLCSCGNHVTVRGKHLLNGQIVSCGCYRKEIVYPRLIKHNLCCSGDATLRLYHILQSMKQRCYNPNSQEFHLYGGKGIIVCEEWINDLAVFVNWALTHGYKPGLTIDRIDSNGDYCPENCQWLTRADNARKSVVITNEKRWGYRHA